MSNKYKMILASQSPRRKELLSQLNIPFDIKPSNIEEVSPYEDPIYLVQDLAKQKGEHVLKNINKNYEQIPFVLSSDTVVALDGKLYGKPESLEEAFKTLSVLSGKTHQVVTAVYFGTYLDNGDRKEKVFYESSKVTFAKIDQDVLENYVETGEPFDKAGGYGIQGSALIFIDRLDGSYSNVVGLPISRVHQELKQFLFELGESKWRSCFE